MARTRLLSPKFFLDDDLAERSAYARLTFAGLILIADREGRLDDRPKVISAELFPFEDVDMDALLDELAATRNGSGGGGFILRYQVNGRRYLEIRNFLKYQTPHFREACSAIPPPRYKPEPRAEPRGEPEAEQACMDPVMYGSGMDPVLDPVRGNSDPAIAGIGSRYVRAEGDVVWFEANDTLGWSESVAVELQKRFPARTRQLGRLGRDWLGELRGLSNWHATAPKSKKKQVSAERWLLGRLFAKHERSAVHAEQHLPPSRQPPRSASIEHSEPQHYDAPIDPEIFARNQKREAERIAKAKAWREEKPPENQSPLARLRWVRAWRLRKP